MNFRQKISSYVIRLLTEKDIPDIGMTGLMEGLDSDNLRILAGLDKNESPFVLHNYLINTLDELNLKLPNESVAIMTVADFFADEIIKGRIDPYEGFIKLHDGIGINKVMEDHYDLMEAYSDYILIWETVTDGLYFYDKSKMTKEQFITETKQALIDSLKRRNERKNAT